jgi:hypothetical protein
VPHLRRSAMFRNCVPALPGWADVWRVGPPGLESGCERKGDASIKSSRWAEAVFHPLGWPKGHDSSVENISTKGLLNRRSLGFGMTKGRLALPLRAVAEWTWRAVAEFTKSLDLLLLFSYSGAHARSALSQVLRGLLQEVRPRRVSRNRRLPCPLDIRGLLAVRREAKISTLGSDPRQTACRGPEETPSRCRPPWAVAAVYFGKGASLMVLPSRADCLAASRICMTTIFVSSEVRSPSGSRVPLSTAAR